MGEDDYMLYAWQLGMIAEEERKEKERKKKEEEERAKREEEILEETERIRKTREEQEKMKKTIDELEENDEESTRAKEIGLAECVEVIITSSYGPVKRKQLDSIFVDMNFSLHTAEKTLSKLVELGRVKRIVRPDGLVAYTSARPEETYADEFGGPYLEDVEISIMLASARPHIENYLASMENPVTLNSIHLATNIDPGLIVAILDELINSGRVKCVVYPDGMWVYTLASR